MLRFSQKNKYLSRIRIECEARIGRSSQPSTSTSTLATRPPSSRLPPQAATTALLDKEEGETDSETTLSSPTAATAVAAALRSVALNVSSVGPIEASTESKLDKKKLVEIEESGKTERKRREPKKATESVL